MKKFFSLALVICLLLCLFTACGGDEEISTVKDKMTINVYNWGQYISDGTDGYIDVNKAFTEATGIKVNYITFDSNETMYSKLKTGGVSIDIVVPSDYMVARLIDEGLVQKIDFDNVPNYQYIDEQFKNMDYDKTNEYSVPYTWGTVGIIYNSKYVTKEVDSWDILWDEEYTGKILMFDNPRDAFSLANLKLGHSLNTTDEAELEEAAKELVAQNPIVQAYVMDQIYELMEREEAYIAPYYAGDYLMMAEVNENLEFCFPKEGFNIFVDAMCIPTCAQNKAGAEAYINFLCNPEIAGENLDYLGYSTPLSAAKEFMDPDMAVNAIAYPDAETLSRATAFINLPIETTQLMDKLWLDVKTSSDTTLYIIVAIIVVAVIVAISLTSVVRNNRIKARRRRKRERGRA